MSNFFPPASPPSRQPAADAGPPPRELKPVVVLLLINLGLSIILTVAVLIARHSVINYQLAHHTITSAHQRSTLRDSYTAALWYRVGGNIVVSVIYVFLVRALLRGRRWAYRRVVVIGIIGIVGLVLIQATPYPTWMRVEQLVQALVLVSLLFFVLRPEVRAHYAKDLPGRNVRRFKKQ